MPTVSLRAALQAQHDAYAALFARAGMSGQPAATERYVLEHGTEMTAASRLHRKLRRGEPRMCFPNAFWAAHDHADLFHYTEGYAWRGQRLLPIHHAWVTDIATGEVHDPTWGDADETYEYVGVRFRRDYLIAAIKKSGTYGLFDSGIGPSDIVLTNDITGIIPDPHARA